MFTIWDLSIHEEVLYDHEPTYEWNRYAIVIIKHGIVTGRFLQTFHTFVPCFFKEVAVSQE